LEFWETKERVEFILSHLDKHDFTNKTVLDLGSLRGVFSYSMLMRGAAHVTLIDRNPDAMEFAERKLLEINPDRSRFRCIIGDFLEVEFPDQVNFVLASGVLYHTNRQHELMAKIRRCLSETVLVETLRNGPSDFIQVDYWPNQNIFIPNMRMCEIIFRECGYRSWQWDEFVQGRGIYTLK
jgi:ubiquinone/menaquinone biosynthesis C-methylase UbiE